MTICSMPVASKIFLEISRFLKIYISSLSIGGKIGAKMFEEYSCKCCSSI